MKFDLVVNNLIKVIKISTPEWILAEDSLSESRKNAGIVTVKTLGKNQDGDVVASFKRSALIPTKGNAVDDKIDY